MTRNSGIDKQLHLISELAIRPRNCSEIAAALSRWDQQQIEGFFKLLDQHHVLLRALKPIEEAAAEARSYKLQEAIRVAINAERERIRIALECLDAICNELESAGCPVVLFKTLDHWPDFGSDLDLCTIGDERCVLQVLKKQFKARTRVRNLGDHLARKWSFELPANPTEVEVHINRLGQAGEHVQFANRFIRRRRYMEVNGYRFPVPAPEERVIAAALQRMYRHLYFRVCDIVNLSTLIQSGDLNYKELRVAAEQGGIWPGVAGCLKIVSDYVAPYLGQELDLPSDVRSAAADLGSDRLFTRDGFFYIPFVPFGARLFLRQFSHTLQSGNIAATARLSLLPPLATVGALAFAVTGSSGRVW